MTKTIRKYIFPILCFFFFLGMIRGMTTGYAKDSILRRDVKLLNGSNVTESSYDEKYYVIGDHGLLTFDADDITIDVPPGYTSSEAEDACSGVSITYENEDDSVVEIDEGRHTYTIKGGGKSRVKMKADIRILDEESESGYRYETWKCEYCFISIWDMSGANLEKTKVTSYMIYNSLGACDIAIKDCPDLTYYTFSYTSSNDSMYVDVSLDATDGTIHIQSYVAGKSLISVIINGRQFDIKYVNKTVTINKDTYFMDKGSTVTLKLKGYSGTHKWKSQKSSIAKVSSSGVVKGKKVGTTVIYTEIDGMRIGCCVSVLKKGMTKVVKKAIKVYQTCSYSQPKRMKKGYYDCSSLTWRAYRKIGKYFGDKTYAPVAAAQAYWCVQRGKSLGKWTYKKVEKFTYRPGDLMFGVGANNGRYKGIFHVEMFAGYRVVGFDGKTPYVSMVWASKPDDYYEPCNDIMARP